MAEFLAALLTGLIRPLTFRGFKLRSFVILVPALALDWTVELLIARGTFKFSLANADSAAPLVVTLVFVFLVLTNVLLDFAHQRVGNQLIREVIAHPTMSEQTKLKIVDEMKHLLR